MREWPSPFPATLSRRQFLATAGALGLSAQPALGAVLDFLRRRPVTSIECDRSYWETEHDQTIGSSGKLWGNP